MTRDDVIRLAIEAGMGFNQSLAEFSTPLCDGVEIEELEAFTNLVVEHERKEFAVHAVDIARRAVAEEREACAKVCDALRKKEIAHWNAYGMDGSVYSVSDCANAIRTRGEN